MNWLPESKRLMLQHNEHRYEYCTVDEIFDESDFISPAEFAEAVRTNTMWSLEWDYKPPNGYHLIRASSLAALQDYVENMDVE